MQVIRLIIFSVVMLALSGICNGQAVSSFGASRSQDTSRTNGQLKLAAYAGSGDTTLLIVLPNGDVKKVAKNAFGTLYSAGFGINLTGTTISVDSSEVVTTSRLNDTLINYQYMVNPEQFRTSADQEETELVQAAINYLSGVRETFDNSTGNVTLDSIAPARGGAIYLSKTYVCNRRLVKNVTHPTRGVKFVNSQLYIPLVTPVDSTQSPIRIEFVGQEFPNFTSNYINPRWWLESNLDGGIKSTISNDGSYLPAVIRAVPGDTISLFGQVISINPTDWGWRNLRLTVHHDLSTGTQLSGLDFYNTLNQIMKNFKIDCDVDNINTTAPTFETFAIRSAPTGTGAIQYFENGAISGAFRVGSVAYEHSIWRNVGWFILKYPMDARTANYSIELDNCLIHGCEHVLLMSAGGSSKVRGFVRVESNRVANGVAGKWYSAAGKDDIIDSLNQLRGEIVLDYTVDGTDNPNGIRVNGARQLTIRTVNRDTVGSIQAYNTEWPSGIGLRKIFRSQFAGISLATENSQGQAFLFVNGNRPDANVATNGAFAYMTTGASANPFAIMGRSRADFSYIGSGGDNSTGLGILTTTSDTLWWGTNNLPRMFITPAGVVFLKQTTLLGTPLPDAIENNGTHLYWTSSVGTRHQLDGVTSVGITPGTSGTDVNVSNSPITSSGNITLNIPSASTTARGVITTGTQTIGGFKTFSVTGNSLVAFSSSATDFATASFSSGGNTWMSLASGAAKRTGFFFNNNATPTWIIQNDGTTSNGFKITYGSETATPYFQLNQSTQLATFSGAMQSAGIVLPIRSITAATAITANDYTINVTSGTFTQALPDATAGQVYIVTNTGAGTVTLDPTGTISGAATVTVNTGFTAIIQSLGSGNYVLLNQ